MDAREQIDIAFDFRTDTPEGKDPDTHSPTLRRYHRLLWSKPLPSGEVFELDDTTPGEYLHDRSKLGELFLTSDAVVPTFRYARVVRDVIEVPEEEREEFKRIGYTIGGMMVFPGNRVDGKMTINGARGFHPRIKDRLDLTVECIRRHYRGEWSPLKDVLARYRDFFGLFGSFQGYVEYFLLQDMVNGDCSAVEFSTPFQGFTTSPIPQTLGEYRAYQERAVAFMEARNRRIQSTEGLARHSKDGASPNG